MRLSTETLLLRQRFDDKTAVRMIKEAGFDAFDYSFCYMLGQKEKDVLGDDYTEKAYRLRCYADELGIECNQAHAPLDFGLDDDISLDNEHYARNIRAMEAASILGAKNIIVHGISRALAIGADYIEYNSRYLKSYIPYCKKFGIKISFENTCAITKENMMVAVPKVHTPEEYMKFIDILGNDWFNICVDTGHLAVLGMEPESFIKGLSNKYLKALHIHDNDFIRDLHLLPYAGKLNWKGITNALKEIEYSGDFTLEVINFFASVPDELLASSLKYAEQVGRLLIAFCKS